MPHWHCKSLGDDWEFLSHDHKGARVRHDHTSEGLLGFGRTRMTFRRDLSEKEKEKIGEQKINWGSIR